ncbi:hypothetical protein THARTR1_07120 [Trichoderma harzianum]|uniref:Uncharacterized protein n=1 Tax=Trichoderma harzianum TaxID=5544 RepID=A0A2K0U3K7_TRIHA|nr:hypothetical protein THARTR1_07120 [Trichoderma harzianum]
MWDRARTSATAGLDRLHRRSPRHLKDGPSTDKPEIYLYEYSPANALGIAVSSFNSRYHAGRQKPQKPQRPQRPQRPEIVHDRQLLVPRFDAASTAGIGIFPTDDPADFAASSSRIAFEPPPRNPRRLLRVRQDSKDCAPAYPYPELQIVTDSESISTSTSDGDGYSSSPTSNFKLASAYSRRRLPALDQISPPSSPELGAFKNNAPVSPLDDDDADFPREYPFRGQQPTQSYATQRQMSHVPVPVPVPVHQYTAYQPAPDLYDTSFENPRSLEDVPAPLPQGALPRSTKMRIKVPTDTSAVAQRFRFLTKGKSEPSENLADRPRQGDAPPIHIPRRSSKRASRNPNGLRNISAPLPPIQSGTQLETPPRQQAATDRELLPSSLAPKPLNITPAASKVASPNTNANPGSNALPTPPNHDYYPTPLSIPSARSQSPAGPDLTPTGPRIIKRKPAQTHQAQPSAPSNLSSSSPAYINPPPRRASAAVVTGPRETPLKRTNTDEAWMQPPSRFSVTTYAASNAGTPPQAAVEQMPANAPVATPVMSRPGPFAKRNNAHTPVTIPKQRAYKSSPYGIDNQMAASSEVSLSEPGRARAGSNTESTGRGSILSTAKPLPPAPPELASAPDDRIAQLNAALSALAHRRVNINKSIQQMTELMPRDNLMASAEVLRKREVEKQKVEGLKQELAEIQHEEYDLGLKLHRAYKRQDKDAEFEVTGLWVRRITS